MIRVILPSGSWTDIPQDKPTDEDLKQWIGCDHIELVRVFYDGQYEQLIVDETSALKDDKEANQTATDIYHENTRVHNPHLLNVIQDAASIYGVAVLLTGEHKLA